VTATSARHYAAFIERRHFGALDGLRALSILPVVWHHCSPVPMPGLAGRGATGVALFFAISGFLITTLLLREQRRTGAISLSRFWARRALRIFPLYYAVLGLTVLHTLWLVAPGPQRAHFFRSLPAFATYTTNWFVDFRVHHPVIFTYSWSLATEEQFYLLWPTFLALGSPRRGAVLFMAGLIALDQGAEYGLLAPWLPPHSLAWRLVTSLATPICLGALAALSADDPRGYRFLHALLGQPWSAWAALAVLLGLLASPAPLVLTDVALVALVVSCVLREDHWLAPLLGLPPVAWVGAVSYGIYLLHVPVLGALKHLTPAGRLDPMGLYFVGLPCILGAAALSHRYFERPFLALKQRFAAQPELPTRQVPRAAPPTLRDLGSTSRAEARRVSTSDHLEDGVQ